MKETKQKILQLNADMVCKKLVIEEINAVDNIYYEDFKKAKKVLKKSMWN